MEYELHKRKPAQTPPSGPAALLAGGIAAFLASACCLGPLLLVLGFSGAWISRLSGVLDRSGKPPEVLDFRQGQTEV